MHISLFALSLPTEVITIFDDVLLHSLTFFKYLWVWVCACSWWETMWWLNNSADSSFLAITGLLSFDISPTTIKDIGSIMNFQFSKSVVLLDDRAIGKLNANRQYM